MISFEDIFDDAQGITLLPDDRDAISAIFTNSRVDRKTVPEGYFAYELRESDNSGSPATIENSVRVNHYGTIITKEDLEIGKNEYILLNSDVYYGEGSDDEDESYDDVDDDCGDDDTDNALATWDWSFDDEALDAFPELPL